MKLKSLSAVKLHTMTTLYGKPGTGKTTFISSLKGKTLIIDTDRGLASIDTESFEGSVAECETFNDIMEALSLAEQFDNVAIDHMSNVQELCYKHVLEKNKAKKMLINHYGEASQLLKSVVDILVDLAYKDKNVVVLCQEKSINVEDETNEDVPPQIAPNLMDSVRSYLIASSRIVGHTERVTKSKVIKGVKHTKDVYQVRLAGNPIYTLKVTRKPKLKIPDVITNPTFSELSGLCDGTTQAKKLKQNKEKGEK